MLTHTFTADPLSALEANYSTYPKASPWAELYQPFRPQNIRLNLNQCHFLLLPNKNWVLTQNDRGIWPFRPIMAFHYQLSTINCQLTKAIQAYNAFPSSQSPVSSPYSCHLPLTIIFSLFTPHSSLLTPHPSPFTISNS